MPENLSKTEYDFKMVDSVVGAQMMFVAFGALVLVPLLTGLNPNVALFTAGAGTLLFQLITKRMVPIFLASSFAFIAPIIYGVQTWGIPGTMCGLMAAGVLYVLLSGTVKVFGSGFLHRLLPPIVVGPTIMVIGLILAPVAVFNAIGKTGDGAIVLFPQGKAMVVSLLTLLTVMLVSIKGKGMFKLIPILVGIVVGYIISIPFGMVDLSPVYKAAWLGIPDFVLPEWNFEAILFIVPVAIAPAIEHFGDILAIGNVTGKDYVENPGIHRTMMGDGVATSFAALLGGPPNTTYSEVTGAVTLTKCFNPAIMTWAAIFAILLAFVGKLGAFLQTIPLPVMGGILLLLFGAIVVVGLSILVRANEDLTEARNLAIVAIILIFGIGGMAFSFGEFTLSGIGLSAITGVVLNLLLPKSDKNDVSE